MSELFSELFERTRKTRPHDHPVWRHNPKLQARALAERLGLRVPPILRGPASSELVIAWGYELLDECDRFVFKPNHGGNSCAVLPLVKTPRGRWRSLLGDGVGTWAKWVSWIRREERRRPRTFPHPDNVRGPFFVEAMLPSRPWGGALTSLPWNWKCYVIGGECFFIKQKLTPPTRLSREHRWKFWTPSWEDAGQIKKTRVHVPALPPPLHGDAIVAAAELVARKIDSPFVRVDFYEDEEGPIFGEITPEPGGPMILDPEWDRRMGAAWIAAVGR